MTELCEQCNKYPKFQRNGKTYKLCAVCGWTALMALLGYKDDPPILILDPEPTYRAYWTTKGADAVCTLAVALAYIESNPPYDKIIVSSRLLDCVPELVRLGLRVEVATATPGVSEAAAAYRAGASDYFTKSF